MPNIVHLGKDSGLNVVTIDGAEQRLTDAQLEAIMNPPVAQDFTGEPVASEPVTTNPATETGPSSTDSTASDGEASANTGADVSAGDGKKKK